jgi:hypothetical protein
MPVVVTAAKDAIQGGYGWPGTRDMRYRAKSMIRVPQTSLS